jgi:MerC mercury resistance protein
MSNWKTTTASLGAMVTSLLTLACCLPLPFLGAAGLAGASVFLSAARPWLLALSVIFLGVGFYQVYRGMKCRAQQSRIALVLLGLAAVMVIFLLLFPQVLAGLLADISSQQSFQPGSRPFPLSRPRTSTNFVTHSIKRQERCASFCSCHLRDLHVCGGLPQFRTC